MSAESAVRALLSAPDEVARQAVLAGRDPDFLAAVVALLKDEVDRERLRDPRAALRLADLAAEAAGQAGTPHARALADWARANVLIHTGDYDGCLSLYRQAAAYFAAEGAGTEVARLLANQAFALKNLGRYAEGLDAARAAVDALRHDPPSKFLGSALNAAATLCRLLRRHDEALALFAAAAQIYAAVGDPVLQARVTVNQANVLENLDRFDEAITALQQARSVLAAHERHLEVARTDLNLGIVYSRLGRHDEALAALDRSEAGFAALDNAMEVAVVALYRADLYAALNLYEELLQLAAHEWPLFEERDMQWQAARALLHQAAAWRWLGDPARAEESVVRAAAAFDRIQDPVWAELARLERAALWAGQGEWARALPAAVRAAEFFEERGMPVRAAGGWLLAARCQAANDDLGAADAGYRRALHTGEALGVPALLIRAHHGLGQLARREGRLPEAHDHLGTAVELIERDRQALRVEEFRLGYLEDKLSVYRDRVDVCLAMGREDEAFACVERAKSGALVDLLLSVLSRRPIDGDAVDGDAVDGALAGRLQSLREQLNWHTSRLEGGPSGERGQAYDLPEAEVWERIRAIEHETLHAWRDLQKTSPLYTLSPLSHPARPRGEDGRSPGLRGDEEGDGGEPPLSRSDGRGVGGGPPLSRSDGRGVGGEGLHPGEVLAQYYVGDDAVYAFVAGPEGLRGCVSLPCRPDQVHDAVLALDITLRSASSFGPEYVAGTAGPLCRQQLAWLYDDLLRPLLPWIGDAERLLVSPDGELFQVPFHALHDGAGYLLERYEVAYTPSAGALWLCRENRRRGAARPACAFVLGYSPGDRLPHVRREVEAVARELPGAAVFVDEDATLARVREHAGRSTVLHLAAHAVFRRDNPLFAALQLSGGDWLRVLDLYTLRLDGALVTLSGCETGRHRLLGGDVVGLSRGLLCAGASALVVSLWPVDDRSAAMLMARFYSRLAAGCGAAAALRAAQLDLVRLDPGGAGAHPFYWAPYCLLGAPEIRVV